jgi:nucleolar pre-ribosomal-associated protein 1
MMADGPHEQEAAILAGYLEAVRPRPGDSEPVYLPDIVETWAHAAKAHSHELLSQVAAVLALLLHVGSRFLHLLPDMRGICETMLHERQLALVSKNLSADVELGFVISPALRLLREMVCLDGGTLARRVLRAQQWTFAQVARNLDVRFRGDGVEDTQKPSVRTNTARFLLGLVKYLPPRERGELLATRGLLSGLLMKLAFDPPELIHETLDCMTESVLSEDAIPRIVKSRLFWGRVLVRMLALYSYTHDRPGSDVLVTERVHIFFLFAVSSPAAGILADCTGLYPWSVDGPKTDLSGEPPERGTGSQPQEHDDEEPAVLSIRNEALLEVSENLKPWSNDKHRQLLVAMFRAAPELVAAYFRAQKGIDFFPKLSMFWMGYAAFLYSTTELPLPEFFGSQGGFRVMPPPTSVVLDSLIPRPLDRAGLARCFVPKWQLVSLFGARLLIKSFEKLEDALRMYGEASGDRRPALVSEMTSPWHLAAEKLRNEFSERVPDLKEVIRWYKSIPSDSYLSLTSTSRLILLYYKLIPFLAHRANFNVAPFLAQSLAAVESGFEDPRDCQMVLLELENLIEIASMSPGMRWFSKLTDQELSAFTYCLKLSSGHIDGLASTRLETILESLAIGQVVLADTGLVAMYRALASLSRHRITTLDSVWTLLDLSITMCANNTLRYLALSRDFMASGGRPPREWRASPIFMAFIDQLPHLVAKPRSVIDHEVLCRFLSAYAHHSIQLGEDVECVTAIVDHLNAMMPKGCQVSLLGIASGPGQETDATNRPPQPEKQHGPSGSQPEAKAGTVGQDRLAQMLNEEFTPLDNVALTRWVMKSVEDVIDDNHATLLTQLLLSEHTSIRKEALTNLLKMAAKVRESSYSDKVQLWLLLSEVAESAKQHIDAGPAPSVFVATAVHALPVVTNPLHPLYEKANKFLMKGPSWSANRIPLLDDILHDEPGDHGTYYAERAWLFPFLLDCLRTPADVEIFRRAGAFEDICTDMANPYMKPGLRTRAFKILYRATCIEGGSTTMVTRFGMLRWLEMQAHNSLLTKEERLVAAALKQRTWQSCDRERVSEWSRGAIPAELGGVVARSDSMAAPRSTDESHVNDGVPL